MRFNRVVYKNGIMFPYMRGRKRRWINGGNAIRESLEFTEDHVKDFVYLNTDSFSGGGLVILTIERKNKNDY